MKLTIENVKPIEGINRYDLYKRVKTSLSLGSIGEAKKFVENIETSYQHEFEEEVIDKLANAFTFICQTRKEKIKKIEEEKQNAEIERKTALAREWFNTLTDEQKEFVDLLTPKYSPAYG